MKFAAASGRDAATRLLWLLYGTREVRVSVGTRTLACLGAAMCALSLFLVSRLPVSTSSADVAWRLAPFGLGTGIFQSPNNSAVMGSVPRPHLGVASGTLATMRNVGMVLGVSIGGVVLYALGSPNILRRPLLAGELTGGFQSWLKQRELASTRNIDELGGKVFRISNGFYVNPFLRMSFYDIVFTKIAGCHLIPDCVRNENFFGKKFLQ